MSITVIWPFVLAARLNRSKASSEPASLILNSFHSGRCSLRRYSVANCILTLAAAAFAALSSAVSANA
jgi:hypothetical protein